VIDEWYARGNYHHNYGDGMDCYKVGVTLGSGASLPFAGGKFWMMGHNYATARTLDNGPIRTSVELTYAPFDVDGTPVTLTKIISLDANQRFNRMDNIYEGAFTEMPIAAGFVRHDVKQILTGEGWMALCEAVSDSKDPARDGDIYLGVILPGAEMLTDTLGHAVAVKAVKPGRTLTYYAGSGWSQGGVEDMKEWIEEIGQAQAAAVTPWQIEDGSGNPVEATGDEQVELFRSVKAGNGRVEIALTDGGTLSAAQVNDLSVAGTANCYVVSAPGTYVFNARVRGNGAGEGVGFEPAIEMADGMTADWLWTDSEGLVSGVALDTTSGDIFLTVGEGRGNALVALMQDGKVVWSWHVWVTDAPQTMTYGNGTVFMDRNLGAAGTTAGGTDAYGMYYQWGRKDPFYGGEKTETSANAFLEAKNGTVVNPAYPALDWAFSKSATTTDGAAANPMTFYNDKVGTGYNWLASPNATLWGEAKTLNDPCPPGYRVPGTGAWEDLISGRQYIDGVSVWDGTNYGMTYTHGGQTAWYPAQGYRNYSSGAIVGLRSSTGGSGAYWSAETSSVKSYYLFFRSKLSSSGSINNELDMNRSYGYTVRCCKE